MVATLTRALGSRHLALAEDAVQDALMTAMQQWSFRGVPANPEAWLLQVARNRALDRLRHGKMATEKEPAIAREAAAIEPPAAEPPLKHELPPLDDDQLGALTQSPVVAMNRAVAVSRVEGALAGLAALDAIDNPDALERHPLLPAIQAELWREAGDTDRAIEAYRVALRLARSAPEQRWLTSRLSVLV